MASKEEDEEHSVPIKPQAQSPRTKVPELVPPDHLLYVLARCHHRPNLVDSFIPFCSRHHMTKLGSWSCMHVNVRVRAVLRV
jgi:hypothetical protein